MHIFPLREKIFIIELFQRVSRYEIKSDGENIFAEETDLLADRYLEMRIINIFIFILLLCFITERYPSPPPLY